MQSGPIVIKEKSFMLNKAIVFLSLFVFANKVRFSFIILGVVKTFCLNWDECIH